MNNVPFANKPAKERYMWRDVERRAALYALSWSSAPPYPIKHLSLVNRVATIGAKEGWCGDFVRAAYRLWFEKGNDPSVEPTLSAAISNIGQNPDAVIALAATDETKAALKSQTEKARGLGIFGSPTFVVEDEIFWGDDRLEDAVAWPGRQRELRSV
jgi:2-hydroxychromene-2-carboxylate isomerase